MHRVVIAHDARKRVLLLKLTLCQKKLRTGHDDDNDDDRVLSHRSAMIVMMLMLVVLDDLPRQLVGLSQGPKCYIKQAMKLGIGTCRVVVLL